MIAGIGGWVWRWLLDALAWLLDALIEALALKSVVSLIKYVASLIKNFVMDLPSIASSTPISVWAFLALAAVLLGAAFIARE
jgi:hypothetical protein